MKVAEALKNLKEMKQDRFYVQLNNLFLSIERGDVEPSRDNVNQIWRLAQKAYDRGDPMIDWWIGQIEQLTDYQF